MKPKKFNKTLRLNKKTITNLNNGEMKDLHGGGPVTPKCPIPTYYLTCETALTDIGTGCPLCGPCT